MGRRGRTNIERETFFFVTTSVIRRLPVFLDSDCCELLLKSIRYYQSKFLFGVLGYVIMPSHFHWIVRVDREGGGICEIMRDIKKYAAWDIMEELELKREGAMSRVFKEEARIYKKQSRKFWEARFDDQVIRNGAMLRTKLSYIHNNPVRGGLADKPEDYPYSSARAYMFGDHSRLVVETRWIEL